MTEQMIFLLKVVQNIETIKFDFFFTLFLINKMYVMISTPVRWVWDAFGLADSPINSAKLSCSIEVMLANNE